MTSSPSQRVQDPRSWIEHLDAWTAITYTSCIAFALCGYGITSFADYRQRHPVAGAAAEIGGLFATLLDVYLALLLISATSKARSVPVAAAILHFRPPWFLRPIVAAYWLAHFVAGPVGVIALRHFGFITPPANALAAQCLMLTLALVVAYASNIFYITSIAILTRNAELLVIAWRMRFLFDILLAIAAPALFHRLWH